MARGARCRKTRRKGGAGMKINMGDKIELTALQLVYLLDDALETLILLAEDGQEVDTMQIATEKVVALFKKRKKQRDEH